MRYLGITFVVCLILITVLSTEALVIRNKGKATTTVVAKRITLGSTGQSSAGVGVGVGVGVGSGTGGGSVDPDDPEKPKKKPVIYKVPADDMHVVGEVGSTLITEKPKQVPLNRSFRSPVVIALPVTRKVPSPTAVRVSQVSRLSFTVQLDVLTPPPKDPAVPPPSEMVHFVVLEEGSWQLPGNSSRLDVGRGKFENPLRINNGKVLGTERQRLLL
eukprot:GFYU01052187.1.p1 GENE.GFYU01052187.1~~GFYU01052187.1.p1  ORF type:complete len:216 (-),score=44.68 GFYU01052187.1:7-654(-)